MIRPDGIPILKSFCVMPHPIAVDDMGTSFLCNANHASIDMRGNADDKVLWDFGAESVDRPSCLDGFDVSSNAA